MTTVNEEESKIGEIILPSSPGEELFKNSLSEMNMSSDGFKNSLSEMNMSSDGEENIEKMEIVEKVEKFNVGKYLEDELQKLLKVFDIYSFLRKTFNSFYLFLLMDSLEFYNFLMSVFFCLFIVLFFYVYF